MFLWKRDVDDSGQNAKNDSSQGSIIDSNDGNGSLAQSTSTTDTETTSTTSQITSTTLLLQTSQPFTTFSEFPISTNGSQSQVLSAQLPHSNSLSPPLQTPPPPSSNSQAPQSFNLDTVSQLPSVSDSQSQQISNVNSQSQELDNFNQQGPQESAGPMSEQGRSAPQPNAGSQASQLTSVVFTQPRQEIPSTTPPSPIVPNLQPQPEDTFTTIAPSGPVANLLSNSSSSSTLITGFAIAAAFVLFAISALVAYRARKGRAAKFNAKSETVHEHVSQLNAPLPRHAFKIQLTELFQSPKSTVSVDSSFLILFDHCLLIVCFQPTIRFQDQAL
jgi:hypothetical protein